MGTWSTYDTNMVAGFAEDGLSQARANELERVSKVLGMDLAEAGYAALVNRVARVTTEAIPPDPWAQAALVRVSRAVAVALADGAVAWVGLDQFSEPYRQYRVLDWQRPAPAPYRWCEGLN